MRHNTLSILIYLQLLISACGLVATRTAIHSVYSEHICMYQVFTRAQVTLCMYVYVIVSLVPRPTCIIHFSVAVGLVYFLTCTTHSLRVLLVATLQSPFVPPTKR